MLVMKKYRNFNFEPYTLLTMIWSKFQHLKNALFEIVVSSARPSVRLFVCLSPISQPK
jgi:hypothetical protein